MPQSVLARLRELRPWDNINEEDLFRVDGLYLSIRGNVRAPEGAWCTRSQDNAARWVGQPDADPLAEDWVYDAAADRVTHDGLSTDEAAAALEQVLNQFEGLPHQGLEFPVWLNPTE